MKTHHATLAHDVVASAATILISLLFAYAAAHAVEGVAQLHAMIAGGAL